MLQPTHCGRWGNLTKRKVAHLHAENVWERTADRNDVGIPIRGGGGCRMVEIKGTPERRALRRRPSVTRAAL